MKKFVLIYLFLLLSAVSLPALDGINLWRHSEIADKNSVFADVALAPFMLDNFDNFEFNALPVEVRIDWLPPLPLPFSAGIFFKTPYPNLKSFGIRFAYHFDLLDPLTDLYFAYVFDFGFIRNRILAEYNDSPVSVYWHDFRLGVRRFFGSRLGLAVETGFKFESIIFLLSIKIN